MNHAQPRGWTRGELVNKVDRGGKPAVERDASIFDAPYLPVDMFDDRPPPSDPTRPVTFLVFSNERARAEWLKWWNGKGK